MNEERAMILKMLKDGKITVDEAEALLEVIQDKSEEGAAFTAENQPQAGSAGHEPASDNRQPGSSEETRQEVPREEHAPEREEQRSGEKRQPFGFEFDMKGLESMLQNTLSGVGETVRSAFEGLKDLDLEGGIKRALGRERVRAEKTAEFSPAGTNGVEISTISGDITVEGWDGDTIRIDAVFTVWGNDAEEAREQLAKMRIREVNDGDTLKFSHETPEETLRSRVDYRIRLPRGLNVTLKTLSGDLSVANVTGEISCTSTSGDIEVNEAAATVAARTVSGDITLTAVEGDISTKAVSGDIEMDNAAGNIDASTKSGDLSYRPASGTGLSLKADTVSGEIDTDYDFDTVEKQNARSFAASTAEWTIKAVLRTVSGDISVEAAG